MGAADGFQAISTSNKNQSSLQNVYWEVESRLLCIITNCLNRILISLCWETRLEKKGKKPSIFSGATLDAGYVGRSYFQMCFNFWLNSQRLLIGAGCEECSKYNFHSQLNSSLLCLISVSSTQPHLVLSSNFSAVSTRKGRFCSLTVICTSQERGSNWQQ